MRAEAKRAAAKAESSPTFRILARAGYAANGLVHVLIGIIVLVLAFGGVGEGDQAGALKTLAAAPLGFAALWLIALTLCALGAYHAVDGVLAGRRVGIGETAKKWGRRASAWGQAVIFVAVGALAASVALGARPDAEETAEEASRGVLAIPGGEFLLGATGIGIGAGGIAFIVMGAWRSFENRIRVPLGPVGTAITTLGVVGFLAKGVALLIVGVLLLVAAIRLDPETAGGLDGAMRALLDLPLGEVLAGIVGLGLIAYGVFCGFRARYAQL